jgi:hypothetical protein
MEVYGSRYVKVRLTTATEHHHHKGKLTRIRVQSLPSHFTVVLMAASLVLAGLLALKMWPYGRTAVLIPLAWWAMFVVDRWRVTGPVLGMIDAVAERLNYYPVHAEPAAERKPAQPAAAAEESTAMNPQPDKAPMEGLLDDEGEAQVA